MIPHNRPTLGPLEAAAAQRVIESGWLAQGPEVAAFEREMCHYLGLPEGHAVALSSGTAALFTALWALGAKDRRIAIPSYSCAALSNAVIMAGGIPVHIDVACGSAGIDLAEVATRDADIVVVAHMFGIPLRCSPRELSTPVIEDCAQSLGARIDGQPVGLQGAIGIFSFYATKMITSGGQGGMLVSRDRALVDAVRDYREFDSRHDCRPRFNFQMTDLQAAIGRTQLQQLESFLTLRAANSARYEEAGLPLWPQQLGSGITPCHYRAILRVNEPERLIAELKQAGIRSIIPIEDWELLGCPESLTNALALTRSTVSLPVHPLLTRGEIDRIIGAVKTSL